MLQPDSNSTEDDYAKVLGYSYLFYEAQQSGVLPSWNRLLYGTRGLYGPGYKKNAHVNDGAVIGKDLSGGWYDAGGEPMGSPGLCCTSNNTSQSLGPLTALHLCYTAKLPQQAADSQTEDPSSIHCWQQHLITSLSWCCRPDQVPSPHGLGAVQHGIWCV